MRREEEEKRREEEERGGERRRIRRRMRGWLIANVTTDGGSLFHSTQIILQIFLPIILQITLRSEE